MAVPDTLVTSDPAAARAFAAAGPVVAKAVSTGLGIAPFTDTVTADQLELVAACPVLLQRRVLAAADLRVVTVGMEVLTWSRPRVAAEPLDWRLADPAGCGFRPCPAGAVAPTARRIAGQLALTFSVQDWLATADGPGVSRGQPARPMAVPRRRRPARGPRPGRSPPGPMTAPTPLPPPGDLPGGDAGQAANQGRWPHPLRRFWWDLLPGWLPDRWVPPAGGVRAPPYAPPSWLAEDAAGTPEALEQAKRAHDIAVARVQTVEAKADRLAQRALALLVLAFAVAGWQLRTGRTHGGGWWYLLLAPAAAAIAALAAAGITALELDRPGGVPHPEGRGAAWTRRPDPGSGQGRGACEGSCHLDGRAQVRRPPGGARLVLPRACRPGRRRAGRCPQPRRRRTPPAGTRPDVDDRRDGHDQGGAEPYDAARAEPAAENLTTATPVSALRLLHRG